MLLTLIDVMDWARVIRDDGSRAPSRLEVKAAWRAMTAWLEQETLAFVDDAPVLRRDQFSDDGWRFATLRLVRWWSDALHRGRAPSVTSLARWLEASREGRLPNLGLSAGRPHLRVFRRDGSHFTLRLDAGRVRALDEIAVEQTGVADLVTESVGLWARRVDVVDALDGALASTPHDRVAVPDREGRPSGVVFSPRLSVPLDVASSLHPQGLPLLYRVGDSVMGVRITDELHAEIVGRCSRVRSWVSEGSEVWETRWRSRRDRLM